VALPQIPRSSRITHPRPYAGSYTYSSPLRERVTIVLVSRPTTFPRQREAEKKRALIDGIMYHMRLQAYRYTWNSEFCTPYESLWSLIHNLRCLMRAPITDIKVHLGMKPDQYPLRSRVPTSPRVLGIGLKVTEPNLSRDRNGCKRRQ
jgi:hypothetical protein